MAPYSAQIQSALEEFLREHPAGDGSGDVVGPASAVNDHLVAFDGTTGRLLKDGGVIPAPLPVSTGANKVLFDDGETQAWSEAPILDTVTVERLLSEDDAHPTAIRIEVTGDGSGIDWHNNASATFVRVIRFTEPGGRVVIGTEAGDGVYLRGFGHSEVGLDCNNDGDNPVFFCGVNNSNSFDWTHEGALLFGRSLNASADNQTWFGDTVHPVFLVGTPDITVQSDLRFARDTRAIFGDITGIGLGDIDGQIRIGGGADHLTFQVQNGVEPEVGAIGWSDNNFVVGTKGGVRGGTGRDVVIGAAAGAPNGIYLATEDAARWQIDPAGLLRPFVDATYDIGTPDYHARSLYLSGYVNFGTDADEEGFGIRNNAGTIEAKNDGGEWAALGSGSVPGEDTQVLFNDGGALGADEGFAFGKTNRIFQITAVTNINLGVVSTPNDGSTTWSYAVIATFDDGSTTGASASSNASDGPAVLDVGHFNTVTWLAQAGAVSYSIYRVALSEGTPSSLGLIGTTPDLTFTDTGIEGDGSAPPTNTTGRVVTNIAQLSGPLVSDSDTLTLGLPGAPTADQTIQPAASTSGSGASLSLNGGTTPAGSSEVDGGSVVIFGGGVTDTGAGGAAFYTHGASGINGGSLELYGGSAGEGGAAGVIQLHSAAVADAPITAPDFIVSGSRFKTDTVDGHTASLSAYDVDGAAYVDFIQLTNGNTPTCVVKATDFRASNDASGVDASIVIPAVATITVKNGLITAVV